MRAKRSVLCSLTAELLEANSLTAKLLEANSLTAELFILNSLTAGLFGVAASPADCSVCHHASVATVHHEPPVFQTVHNEQFVPQAVHSERVEGQTAGLGLFGAKTALLVYAENRSPPFACTVQRSRPLRRLSI